MSHEKESDWISKGKTIEQLIEELKTFEQKDIEVRISVDNGETFKAISLVGKKDGCCCLISYES